MNIKKIILFSLLTSSFSFANDWSTIIEFGAEGENYNKKYKEESFIKPFIKGTVKNDEYEFGVEGSYLHNYLSKNRTKEKTALLSAKYSFNFNRGYFKPGFTFGYSKYDIPSSYDSFKKINSDDINYKITLAPSYESIFVVNPNILLYIDHTLNYYTSKELNREPNLGWSTYKGNDKLHQLDQGYFFKLNEKNMIRLGYYLEREKHKGFKNNDLTERKQDQIRLSYYYTLNNKTNVIPYTYFDIKHKEYSHGNHKGRKTKGNRYGLKLEMPFTDNFSTYSDFYFESKDVVKDIYNNTDKGKAENFGFGVNFEYKF